MVDKYEHPLLAVDILVFTFVQNALQLVLIKRKGEPFKDSWAIPGGLVEIDETLNQAALRELKEETAVTNVVIEQFGIFDNPDRDPRGRIISISYFALVSFDSLQLKASSDAKEIALFPVSKLPNLAFDHRNIIKIGLEKLREKILQSNLISVVMPDKFRMSELQKAYELILDKKLDKRNFIKRMRELAILEDTGLKDYEGTFKPASLYRFTMKNS